MISKIISSILTIIVVVWIFIFSYDYIRVSNEGNPEFCITEETKKYDDGTTYICHGLGYKYINHNRKSYKAIQFGGFWIEEEVKK